MMEQFEALTKDGYTVLLGGEPEPEPEPEEPEPEEPEPALDYSRFDDLDDASDDGGDVDLAVPSEDKLDDLGDDTKKLWNVIFKIAKGNPKECQRLMENPDELQKHPEVLALYEDT